MGRGLFVTGTGTDVGKLRHSPHGEETEGAWV